MHESPGRWALPGMFPAAAFAGFLGILGWSLVVTGLSPLEMIRGAPYMADILRDMVPPDRSRLVPMLGYAWVTIEMAVVGTTLGILISIPLGFLAADNHSPHPAVRHAVRGLVTFFRSIPELVWGLFFVASVGLGPQAGVLAIMADTIGYAGRFFAEHLEEVDPAPSEALACIGAGKIDILAASTIPSALPAMTATSLYSLERGIRSSTILGIVGAGGIGVELMVSFEMGYFDQAATFILIIFLIIWLFEALSTALRRQFLPRHQ